MSCPVAGLVAWAPVPTPGLDSGAAPPRDRLFARRAATRYGSTASAGVVPVWVQAEGASRGHARGGGSSTAGWLGDSARNVAPKSVSGRVLKMSTSHVEVRKRM